MSSPSTLRAVLRALGLPADSDGEIRDSRAQLHEQAGAPAAADDGRDRRAEIRMPAPRDAGG